MLRNQPAKYWRGGLFRDVGRRAGGTPTHATAVTWYAARAAKTPAGPRVPYRHRDVTLTVPSLGSSGLPLVHFL